MSTPVAPKDLYSDCDRAERKRIARGFAIASAASRATDGQVRIPEHLYACGWCKKLRCDCVDGEGKPLRHP